VWPGSGSVYQSDPLVSQQQRAPGNLQGHCNPGGNLVVGRSSYVVR
jgi:hypothetical protein